MMKNNLGKTIYFLLVFIPYILNAQVLLKAPESFYKNDMVQFTIIAQGSDVSIPDIKNVDGNVVQNGGTSQQTTIVNGKRTYQIAKKYLLRATKDINIPSFKIVVDNVTHNTVPKTIKMLKVEKTKSDLYDLAISIDKDDVYVGEAVEFTLKFKYKKDLQISGLDFQKPSFDGFWVKELKVNKNTKNSSEYKEQELKYLLFPQNSGNIELGPLKIGVNTLKDGFNSRFYFSAPTVTTAVYSNKLSLKVKALPSDINLIGNFEIYSTVDKITVSQGEAVSYKLYIKGRGNIDDLDEVNLDILDATIYDNPSKKEYNLENNVYGGTYTKTYSIVGKNDFVIPSIKLQYFDKKSQTIKTITTQEHPIKVQGTPKVESKLEIEKPAVIETRINTIPTNINSKSSSNLEKFMFFFIGLISGIILIFGILFLKKKMKKQEEIPLLKMAKSSKTAQELFKILVIYINIDKQLDKIIFNLENLSEDEYKKQKKNIIKSLNELIQKDIKLDTHFQ